MLNVKEMTFEEFIEFGEEKTGSKCDDAVKELLKIIFDNLKSGAGLKMICVISQMQ